MRCISILKLDFNIIFSHSEYTSSFIDLGLNLIKVFRFNCRPDCYYFVSLPPIILFSFCHIFSKTLQSISMKHSNFTLIKICKTFIDEGFLPLFPVPRYFRIHVFCLFTIFIKMYQRWTVYSRSR